MNASYDKCVACSGELETQIVIKEAVQQVCIACGGVHTTTTVENYNDISKGMRLIDADFDDTRYFDISGVDEEGKTIKRCHGWNKRLLGFHGIVQFG